MVDGNHADELKGITVSDIKHESGSTGVSVGGGSYTINLSNNYRTLTGLSTDIQNSNWDTNNNNADAAWISDIDLSNNQVTISYTNDENNTGTLYWDVWGIV